MFNFGLAFYKVLVPNAQVALHYKKITLPDLILDAEAIVIFSLKIRRGNAVMHVELSKECYTHKNPPSSQATKAPPIPTPSPPKGKNEDMRKKNSFTRSKNQNKISRKTLS